MRIFQDRVEAGKILAEKLAKYAAEKPVILALPRGGLPVAAEIATRLKATLDILAVKKIGAPGHPELAIGAISEDGIPVLNEELVAALDSERLYIAKTSKEKAEEVKSQVTAYRKVMPLVSVNGRPVILVDDGLATGATMEAAVRVLKDRGASKIIVAVPVASREAYEKVREAVDEILALAVPREFYAVGQFYHDFCEVSDEDAIAILKCQGPARRGESEETSIDLLTEAGPVKGDLVVPPHAKGIILFAHGSGSSRKSPRNKLVAEALQKEGFATLLFDLLTEEEAKDRKNVFDIDLLADRLSLAKGWVKEFHGRLPIAYFGASTGAAAALQAAAHDPTDLFAIVSRGGRPDMALASLPHISVPTLLLVGGEDGQVISLNRAAYDRLPRGRLVIIPGAGHIFEEPGKIEEVVEYAADWFQQHLPEHELSLIEPKQEVLREIVRLAKPLNRDRDLHDLANQVAHSRVVMLGEATHGTHEFYEIRRELSKILINDHGFNFIAVEGDWPDCFEINRYIMGRKNKGIHAIMESFQRWPTWMWANEEVLQLADWMREQRASFYGLDVYSLFESIRAIQKHVKDLDGEVGAEFIRSYSCFEPFERDEVAYAKSLLSFPKGCKEEVARNLSDLLKIRLENTRLTEEELFNVRQNARVIKNAESYYRAMLSGEAESWNVRDRHMMEMLTLLLKHHGPNSKAIVWAHNTHIGDYRATDMVDEGYVNLGGMAREAMGEDQVSLVGFGTYGGSVRAGKAWGSPEQVMQLPDAKKGSLEAYFHKAVREIHHEKYFLIFDAESRRRALGRRHGHRAVGVVYSPAYEISGHNYVPTELANRYDAFVYVDRTSALQSLKPKAVHGFIPETWPSGL
jgi:putative phosphoribosyl transferase